MRDKARIKLTANPANIAQHCGRNTLAGRKETAHLCSNADGLKIGGVITLFYAVAGLFALTASAAVAADLPPPAPEGWIVTLGIGPEVFTSFPGAGRVSVWPTGYIRFHRPGDSR
jgi:hypothetical protein